MRRATSLRPSAHAEIQAAIHDELDDIVEEKNKIFDHFLENFAQKNSATILIFFRSK